MKILSITFLVLVTTLAYGQKISEHRFIMNFSGISANYDDINQSLNSADIGNLDDFGAMLEMIYKYKKEDSRWTGAFGFTYLGRESAGNDIRDGQPELVGGGVSFGIEYDVFARRYVRLSAGLYQNLEYFVFNIIEGRTGTDLTTTLQDDLEITNLTSFQAPILAGLNAQFRIMTPSLGPDWIGINIQGGYRWHYDNNWTVSNTGQLDDDLNLSSPYLGLGIELGGFGEWQKE